VAERRLVRAGSAEFYMELADTGGPAAIRSDHVLSFDGVRATVEAIATELAQVWDKVRPSEATVEFGLNLTARSGRLTGLVVEGGADASLKITMTWTHSERAARIGASGPDGSDDPG
jgi:Trypsin-co-occurring domain 1